MAGFQGAIDNWQNAKPDGANFFEELVRIMSKEKVFIEEIVWSSGKVMELREYKTIVCSEVMDRLFTDGLILVLMKSTLSKK